MADDSLRSLGELLKALGFNPEEPSGAQAALLRHLIRDAAKHTIQKHATGPIGEQLEFSKEVLGIENAAHQVGRKISSKN